MAIALSPQARLRLVRSFTTNTNNYFKVVGRVWFFDDRDPESISRTMHAAVDWLLSMHSEARLAVYRRSRRLLNEDFTGTKVNRWMTMIPEVGQ